MANFLNMHELPQAASVQIRYCTGELCKNPHIVLLDECGKPFAQFVQCPSWFLKVVETHLARAEGKK